jgi:transglutaminase-like putative cysteine protease
MSASALRVRSATCAALLGLVGVIVPANALAESAVLFAIPTEVEAAQPLAPNSPWRIALHAADLSALARVLNVPQPARDANVLDYVLDAYPEISGNSTRTWLESSFLIDYREREVAELYAAFKKAAAGKPWTREALVAFVATTMTGAVAHPFEVASQVARDRIGDCKSYAALTAALARSAGVPARVPSDLYWWKSTATTPHLGMPGRRPERPIDGSSPMRHWDNEGRPRVTCPLACSMTRDRDLGCRSSA